MLVDSFEDCVPCVDDMVDVFDNTLVVVSSGMFVSCLVDDLSVVDSIGLSVEESAVVVSVLLAVVDADSTGVEADVSI